jgi:hypothetical protein
MLRKLVLGERGDFTFVVEENGARAGRALVER